MSTQKQNVKYFQLLRKPSQFGFGFTVTSNKLENAICLFPLSKFIFHPGIAWAHACSDINAGV